MGSSESRSIKFRVCLFLKQLTDYWPCWHKRKCQQIQYDISPCVNSIRKPPVICLKHKMRIWENEKMRISLSFPKNGWQFTDRVDNKTFFLTKPSPAPTAGSHFSPVAILTFLWARKISPVGAEIFPNGGAESTSLKRHADFLTESFLSRIKDKQENGVKILKFSFSHFHFSCRTNK